MRADRVRQQLWKQGITAVVAIALCGLLGLTPAAQATVLSSATWDLSTKLSTGGGSLVPVSGSGVLVPSTGLPPSFNNGLSLAAGQTEQYSLPSNASLTKGLVSIWYQVPYAYNSGSWPVGSGRVISITTQNGAGERVLDISKQISGQWQAYEAGASAQIYPTVDSGSYNAGDWLFFTFQYNFTGPTPQASLWVGDYTRGDLTAAGAQGTAAGTGEITFSGALTGSNAGIWIDHLPGASSDAAGGVWDDLYITDTNPYSFSQATIPMLDAPLAFDPVPEPSTMLLFGVGGAVLAIRRRWLR